MLIYQAKIVSHVAFAFLRLDNRGRLLSILCIDCRYFLSYLSVKIGQVPRVIALGVQKIVLHFHLRCQVFYAQPRVCRFFLYLAPAVEEWLLVTQLRVMWFSIHSRL